MTASAQKSAWVALHVAVLLFGLAGLFAKFLATPSMVIVIGRTFFATLALLAWLTVKGWDDKRPTLKELPMLALLGVILALHWWSFFYAIRISTVAIGLLGFAAFPMFVTVAEPFFFKERFRWFDALTATAIMIGLITVAWPIDLAASRTWGVLWGAFSGLLFAVLSLLNRRYVRRQSPIVMACFQNGFACLTLLPALFTFSWQPTGRELALLLLLGLVCTALAHALFIQSLSTVRAQLAGIVASLEPVYGIFFAFILLGEMPSLTALSGGAIIIGTTCAAMLFRAKQSSADQGAS